MYNNFKKDYLKKMKTKKSNENLLDEKKYSGRNYY